MKHILLVGFNHLPSKLHTVISEHFGGVMERTLCYCDSVEEWETVLNKHNVIPFAVIYNKVPTSGNILLPAYKFANEDLVPIEFKFFIIEAEVITSEKTSYVSLSRVCEVFPCRKEIEASLKKVYGFNNVVKIALLQEVTQEEMDAWFAKP